MQLRDQHLLLTESDLGPFQRLAHVQTFDETPIFGGREYREKVLAKDRYLTESKWDMFDPFAITKSIARGYDTINKLVDCQLRLMTFSTINMLGGSNTDHFRLEYANNCG